MVKQAQARKRYPSDLTDEQWAIVAPLIPPAKSGPRDGHPRQVDTREVLNTLFSLNRSGCQWDMLPHDLLPKSTVYDYSLNLYQFVVRQKRRGPSPHAP